MRHQGSCHCGVVVIQVDVDLSEVLECNCSWCRRHGVLWRFVSREQLALKTHPSSVSTYQFNSHRMQHRFCARCGVAMYAEVEHPDTGGFIAGINVRCLDEVDLASLRRVPFNGAIL